MKTTQVISKIISVASFAALLCASSTANALPWLPGHFVSGVEVGYISQSGDLDSTNFVLTSVGPVTGTDTQRISDSGTIYGALVGYQIIHKCWLVGLEGHLDAGRYEKAKNVSAPLLTFLNSAAAQNLYYQRGTTYGVSARIGYIVPPCFTPYIRIGGEGSKNKLSVTYNNLGALVFDHFEEYQTSWHWLFGVGVEVPLFSKKTSIRLEYDYSPARSRHYDDTVAPVQVNHSYSPHSHVTKLQWVWSFC